MYCIYTKRPKDKRFREDCAETDSFERADEWLEKMIRNDNERGARGNRYQIRDGRKIVREAEN